MSRRPRIRFDERGLSAIMRHPEVRAALHNKAEEIAARARTIAASEIDDDFASQIRVSDETRPSGRPVSKVEATRDDAPDHEWGSTNTERRRVLGRAGNVQPQTIFRDRGNQS
ncbi:hypothetical protein [Streptomyces sp. DHE17-7]|uniref:hypothetical protein n=1 Tax=Streptomyces sp. DHE17-7 TaxID=2759949 RepID=UPI000EBC7412|nr:hypothetical protein [Streptomyces sp. DHE17-7]MBJ6623649.1 hypothetical protein [Streptomyces sp. DHE17-7]RIH58384.1 hypothetical protein D3C59_35435 [Streptomyces sp. SHP22-7]